MPGELVYTVRKGDTLEAIAKQYYGSQRAVAQGIAQYNRLSPGAALRQGDALKLPPRLFFLAGPPSGAKKPSSRPPVCFWLDFALRLVDIRLSDDELAPFAGRRFSLAVGAKTFEGTLTETGSLRVPLPPGAASGKLTIWLEEDEDAGDGAPRNGATLNIPIDLDAAEQGAEMKGEDALSRLKNLGYYTGEQDSVSCEEAIGAIARFQAEHDLPSTGVLDDETKAKLRDVHGH
jgi:LysM repeat protein